MQQWKKNIVLKEQLFTVHIAEQKAEQMNYKQKLEIINRCQRNWDKEFVIPQEHLDELIDVAANTPTKQYESYYNLYVIINKELIAELLDYTYGYVMPMNGKYAVWRNPQMGASAYFIWTGKIPTTVRNFKHDGSTMHEERNENIFCSVGVSSGILAYHAAGLGYSIGFNRNHWNKDDDSYFNKKLGIPIEERIILGQGIGMPKYNKHNKSDEDCVLIDDEVVQVDNPLTYPSFSSMLKRNTKVKIYE